MLLDIVKSVWYIFWIYYIISQQDKYGIRMKRFMKRTTMVTGVLIFSALVSLGSLYMLDVSKTFYSKIQLFNIILGRIQEDYVTEIPPEKLVDDAIRGMLEKLDPHTTYFTEEQFNRWNQNFEGYSGIGITFDILRDRITVLSVIPEGPSDSAGLMPGDRIVAIEGKSAIGISRDEVPLLLKGPKGSSVRISVQRTGYSAPLEYVIKRDEVHIHSIPYTFLIQPGVGYIHIQRFSATTSDELEKAFNKLLEQGMKTLIFDLRYNGGGYLDEAIETADLFLPGGKTIVSTRGRNSSSNREFYSTKKKLPAKIPVVIMIDRISASASEIVAGALQDWDRALIIGETSFGKGLIQSQYRFRDGSALLMTTARYHTPSGRVIQRDYNNQSHEDYYSIITNDSLRRQWEENPGRPHYQSMILKRRIPGGGGITPDIFLSATHDTLAMCVRRILNSPKRLLFTFTEQLAKDRTLKEYSESDFIRNYKPDAHRMKQFLMYIRQEGIEISNEDFIHNQKDIQFLIKQALAEWLFGRETQYKVQMLRDKMLLEALRYLSKARELLESADSAQSYRSED
ncbi:MAG TPA: S41 family peptidase [bacterium]|nr:S41 family peptidase [bacterium]